jgi:hypothetical protein
MEGIPPEPVLINDTPVSKDTSFSQTSGFRMIQSSLDEDFFREDADLYNVTARGSAIVEAESGDSAKTESFFSVKLQMFDETQNPTVSYFVRVVYARRNMYLPAPFINRLNCIIQL